MATGLVHHAGLAGVLLGMTLESAGIPIPSEVIMPVGALMEHTIAGLVLVILAGTAGNLVGSWIAYGIGAALGVEWRGARWLNREHWEAAHAWFSRHGDAAVFFGRMLPVVRTYISFPAGAAGMGPARFTLYTVLGSVIWSAALAVAGWLLGAHWQQIVHFFHGFTDLTVLALILAVVWLLMRRWRRGAASRR